MEGSIYEDLRFKELKSVADEPNLRLIAEILNQIVGETI